MSRVTDKLRLLAIDLVQDGSLESLTAAACLMSLCGALCEGGESLGAFSDFCENYSRNMVERLGPMVEKERERGEGEVETMTTHRVKDSDKHRIQCQDSRWHKGCDRPADMCEHREWTVGSRNGVSFFYHCDKHWELIQLEREAHVASSR